MRFGDVLIGTTVVISLSALFACGQGQTAEAKVRETRPLRVSGSSTMHGLVGSLADAYVEPDVAFEIDETSTGFGLKAIIAGKIDIARASREVRVSEYEAASSAGIVLKSIAIGFDPVVIAVHPSRADAVEGLTRAQLLGIFVTNEIDDWSMISDAFEGPIDAVASVPGSGTVEYFAVALGVDGSSSFSGHVRRVDHTSEVCEYVAQAPGAIGVGSRGVCGTTVSFVPVGKRGGDYTACTDKNIRNGAYMMNRSLNLVVRLPMEETVRRFLSFTLAEEGQAIVHEQGFSPVRVLP